MMGTKARSRLLLVSNRLPVTVRADDRNLKVVPSAGGLATGLGSPHEKSNGLWFGWPGDLHRLSDRNKTELESRLETMRLVPIPLSRAEVQHYYHGFSNGVLWPLFHYLLDRIPLDSSDWGEYQKVNERFAEVVAERYEEGDLIWVHDYQLALVPALLRRRLPRARIGFFLHIPFPSSEVFRLLPWRAEILKGLLGADLVGFHTYSYLRHFATSLLRILGLEVEIDRLWLEERQVQLGVFPMGIDADYFEKLALEAETRAEAKATMLEGGGGRIILGIDRLDYTKGIPRRLLAFERLLDREATLRGRVRLIQVAVPTRIEVHAYEAFKRQVDELIGRINGKYGTARYTPIHYIFRSLPQHQLVGLYRAADVMAVTPLRDGLNLVAKEFVASKVDLDGVLVLSEFAGVSSELAEALIVNPYDIDGMASAFAQALRMRGEERALRLGPMRERIKTHDVHRWVGSFLEELAAHELPEVAALSTVETLDLLPARLRAATHLVLLLDYDGTLAPIVKHPDLAVPSAELLKLLEQIGRRPRTTVHIVSGRNRGSLERWLGHLPATLHAEHGLWSRAPRTREWVRCIDVTDEWKPRVRPILEAVVKHLPGSFIEEKSAGIAWHYRQADPESGGFHAKELRLTLIEALSNAPVEVMAGDKVVEVRAQGINKGSIVARALAAAPDDALTMAIGDDRTDEDLFAALPRSGIAVHVGPGPSRAGIRLADPAAVYSLLGRLLRAPDLHLIEEEEERASPGAQRSTPHEAGR
jgi:trehalose 6-phosphate synthase/phosphatase